MDRRLTPTRRRWLAACGGASVGITGLSGCTGSNGSDDENGNSESNDNGEDADKNGTEDVHSGSSGESWPMARFSASNGMATDEWSGPDGPLEEGWTIETGENEKVSGPVVANGLVYVAIEGSKLYAIDVQSGEIEWEVDAEEPEGTLNVEYLPTTPAATDDAVYLLTDTLYALEPDTGDELWSVDLDSRKPGNIRVYDGIVYVHNAGKLYAIDTDEQAITWEGEASSTQDIAIGDDGILYVVRRTNNDNDYEVIGIDISSEGTEWTYSPAGNVASGFGLLVRDKTVYLNEMENLLMIDSKTGDAKTLTEFEQTNELVPTTGQAPTIANEIVYSPAPSKYPAVHAVELDTGEELDTWNSNALENGPTGIESFASKDTLYIWRGFGSVDLNAVDPETGEQQWSFDVRDHQDMIRGTVQGYAILEDRVIYSIDGNYSVIGALETA